MSRDSKINYSNISSRLTFTHALAIAIVSSTAIIGCASTISNSLDTNQPNKPAASDWNSTVNSASTATKGTNAGSPEKSNREPLDNIAPKATSAISTSDSRSTQLEPADTSGVKTTSTDDPSVQNGTSSTATARSVETGATAPQFDSEKLDVVRLLWGTNRKPAQRIMTRRHARKIDLAFGSERNDALTTGIAEISLPKSRAFGSTPRPYQVSFRSFTVFEQSEDPEKHFLIQDLQTLSERDFAAVANEINERAKSFRDHAFVFVHGYRNSFDDGLYRTAQIIKDMGFDGVPFYYSWPSAGSVAGYIHDRDSVDASHPLFQQFLAIIAKTTKCKKIHIIAHSMGTRLVVDSFFPSINRRSDLVAGKLGQIILAAADIDADILKSRASALNVSPPIITLYANSHDDALKWSKLAAGGFVRAGDVINGKPLILSGIDTIDLSPMSDATWVFIGANHNEYAERVHVLSDISLLLRKGVRPPSDRSPIYTQVQALEGNFWRYAVN